MKDTSNRKKQETVKEKDKPLTENPHDIPERQIPQETLEQEAERLLENLLSDKDNAFLTEHEENKKRLDEFSSAVQALAFALKKIDERHERTSRLTLASPEVLGVEIVNVNPVGIRKNVEEILKHAMEIGRGGDAIVVVDKSEVRSLPPEICYKFAITETTPRGRNSTFSEIALQEAFYKANMEVPESKIGVPIPFYAHEVGIHKVIAMEKLNAKSVDDILHSKGTLPPWFDVDTFCDELHTVLDHFHAKGLYHRDMHEGNIMISQQKEIGDGDKIGFIIDFGLSVQDDTGIEPYKKQVAGTTFTYSDDYGIIKRVQTALKTYQKTHLA